VGASKDALGLLQDLGLTSHQAGVYLAIVRLGTTKVASIAQISKVRREDVYRALPELERLGLIEKILGTPFQVRAVPVEDALSLLVKHQKDELSRKLAELSAKKDEIVKRFKQRPEPLIVEDETAQFSLISERNAILAKGSALFNSVGNRVDYVISRNKLKQFLYFYADQHRELAKRGAGIRIITEEPLGEEELLGIIREKITPTASVKIRYADKLLSHFIIFDDREIVVTTSTQTQWAERPVLWSRNPSHLSVYRMIFDNLWNPSLTLASIKSENKDQRVIRLVQHLRPSDHAIFIYESLEDKHRVQFSFINDGLEKGEACMYWCGDEETPSQVREAMERSGIEVKKLEKTNALTIVDFNDFFLKNGRSSLWAEIDWRRRLYENALAKGFKGLRATGDWLSCWMKRGQVPMMLEMERSSYPSLDTASIYLCAYNSHTLNEFKDATNLYSELIKAHGTVLFTSEGKRLEKLRVVKA
jgi:sugar-specific transcriptional regulator TrmB